MSDDILRQLAVKAGIAPRWTEQNGAEREVSAESLRFILQALGLPAGTDADLRQSLATVEAGANLSAQSRFTTARTGQTVVLPVAAQAGSPVELTLDGGTRRTVRSEEGYDGSLTLPAFDRPGYHTVHRDDGDFIIATAPERCITFADLNGGRAGFGLAAQIYSLRSPQDGGIGNFAGVAALARKAAAHGADALAISPVHALYGASPEHFSPYSPSTRLFYNPLHADPTAVLPEALLREVIAREGLGEEMDRLATLRQIDWPAATILRQRLLRALFEALRAPTAAAARPVRRWIGPWRRPRRCCAPTPSSRCCTPPSCAGIRGPGAGAPGRPRSATPTVRPSRPLRPSTQPKSNIRSSCNGSPPPPMAPPRAPVARRA